METWVIWIIAWLIITAIRAAIRESNKVDSTPQRPIHPQSLRMRLRHDALEGHPEEQLYVVEIMGPLPLARRAKVTAVISVIDTTDPDEPMGVYSLLESFQEKATYAFQRTNELGEYGPGAGSTEWVSIGFVPKNILVPPKSGQRRLAIVTRLYGGDEEPSVSFGFGDSRDPDLLWTAHEELTLQSPNKGYLDAQEDALVLKGLAVRLAVAVASVDGDVADEEGMLIKGWMERAVRREQRDGARLKNHLNESFRKSFQDRKSGPRAISEVVDHIRAIGDKQDAWMCLELCYEVIAADGVAKPEELDLVRRIGNSLGISSSELESLQDQKLIGIKAELESGAQQSLETVLGIDPSWDRDRARRHLREQFRKWNDRMAALQNSEERESAQQMLDLIAEARRRYD